MTDKIRADREAGTPGPWVIAHDQNGVRRIFAGQDGPQVATASVFANWMPVEQKKLAHATADTNARRIARVPELEEIALAAEELVKADQAANDGLSDLGGYRERENRVEAAFARLRKALEQVK